MKSLPPGNYALSIAHPGHELRLHGFLEQAKPFVWILTDGSERTGNDMMWSSINCIDKATKQGKTNFAPQDKSMYKIFKMDFPGSAQENFHVKDSQIYSEVFNGKIDFFKKYITGMVNNLIKYKIDFLVSDASEDYHLTHEVVRMISEIAIIKVGEQTGKEIRLYDFPLSKPHNDLLSDDCIHIQLDEEAVERKIDAIIEFPFAISDLHPNISVDANLISELRKMQNGKEQIKSFLKEINIDFLKNEYIRPALPIQETDNYKKFIESIYEKIIRPTAVSITPING